MQNSNFFILYNWGQLVSYLEAEKGGLLQKSFWNMALSVDQ